MAEVDCWARLRAAIEGLATATSPTSNPDRIANGLAQLIEGATTAKNAMDMLEQQPALVAHLKELAPQVLAIIQKSGETLQ